MSVVARVCFPDKQVAAIKISNEEIDIPLRRSSFSSVLLSMADVSSKGTLVILSKNVLVADSSCSRAPRKTSYNVITLTPSTFSVSFGLSNSPVRVPFSR